MLRTTCDTPGDAGGLSACAEVIAAALPQAIGEIETAIGSATITSASGAVTQVKVGDRVYQQDTIETGADGAVGITFTDRTAFNLSNNARMVLSEFACGPNGTARSALFSLRQGVFSFIGGKVAKTGDLRIDTPVGRIRATGQSGGMGILTLAGLTFSVMNEVQAANRFDAFLDDDTITYKDFPHGRLEITTRDGRVIMHDDPGETIVIDPQGSVTHVPNTSSRMAELQSAQQAALATLSQAVGQQQGAAPGGSSTPTFNVPLQVQPINFSQPQSPDSAPPPVTVTTPATNPGGIDVPVFKPPPVAPPVVTPALMADVSGPHAITEIFNTTSSTKLDSAPSGELTYTDFTPSTAIANLSSMTWSGGATPPSGLGAVLEGALAITLDDAGSNSGAIILTFGAADKNFDFLAAGETLTVVYNVTVTDSTGVSLTQPVTITITGTNDAPVLTADASGPHAIAKDVNTTGSASPDTSFGTLTFTDVDLDDHHTVSASAPAFAWSGGTLTAAQQAALAAASKLRLSETARGPARGRSRSATARPTRPSISSPSARPSPSPTR